MKISFQTDYIPWMSATNNLSYMRRMLNDGNSKLYNDFQVITPEIFTNEHYGLIFAFSRNSFKLYSQKSLKLTEFRNRTTTNITRSTLEILQSIGHVKLICQLVLIKLQSYLTKELGIQKSQYQRTTEQ